MKLTPIAFLALALLLLVNLNGCSVESRTIGHHPPGEGHHPPGEGHHHRDRDHDDDGDDDGGHRHHHRDRDHDDDGDDDDGGHRHKHGRRHKHRRHHYQGYSFYVFGDSFADNGNLPKWDDNWPALSRQWYRPYAADGRFSNKMVQSDFIANILGQSEAPPAHALGNQPHKTGMNFAVGGSGVFKVPQEKPTLGAQVNSFFALVQSGSIDADLLEGKSVALVAVSGNDYTRVGVDTRSFSDITAYVDKVTSEIVAKVTRLLDIGVQNVLVNNLYPLGCAPSMSRPSNYTSCDEQGNQAASLHNRYLSDKLADMDGVLILDLGAAFTEILNEADRGDDDEAEGFVHKRKPCCESFEPSGYCGLVMRDFNFKPPLDVSRYQVCSDADSHFYFDEMHPSQAGWAAVMGKLESPIKEFLEIE